MKNANVFVDVDLTLVDANGELLAGASTTARTFLVAHRSEPLRSRPVYESFRPTRS
jgi:hypothetical protein